MEKPRCYVASPFGFTEAGRTYYYEVVLPGLRAVAEPIDPWAWVTAADVAAAIAEDRHRELWLSVGRQNQAAISSSTCLAAWLDGQEIDSGTASEIGYAAALGLPCFGVRTDLRQSGELGMSVNLQVESLIVTSGGSIVGSLDELVRVIRAVV